MSLSRELDTMRSAAARAGWDADSLLTVVGRFIEEKGLTQELAAFLEQQIEDLCGLEEEEPEPAGHDSDDDEDGDADE